MRQLSGAPERKWNRQLTRPIFPAGTKSAVWKRDYVPIDVSRIATSFDIVIRDTRSVHVLMCYLNISRRYLVFESGDYLHVQRCGNNSRAASDRANMVYTAVKISRPTFDGVREIECRCPVNY